MVERVEEYRYLASSTEDIRPLAVNVLALRIATFHKVHRKMNQPKAPASSPKLTKRSLR